MQKNSQKDYSFTFAVVFEIVEDITELEIEPQLAHRLLNTTNCPSV